MHFPFFIYTCMQRRSRRSAPARYFSAACSGFPAAGFLTLQTCYQNIAQRAAKVQCMIRFRLFFPIFRDVFPVRFIRVRGAGSGLPAAPFSAVSAAGR